MLPTLSRLSVSTGPVDRLRHRCSSGSLRIPPLHPEFHRPLPDSSLPVRTADPGLSPGLSPHADETAYAPFTPSDSGQRSHPPYYRGCWHIVSRSCFYGYLHYSPRRKTFTTRGPSSVTRRRWFRVSPIDQDSPLLPPVGVWPVSQCQCGRVPSQAGYRS